METWALIWKIVFVAIMAVFAGMSIWVIFGGWRDLKHMLQKLAHHDDDDG